MRILGLQDRLVHGEAKSGILNRKPLDNNPETVEDYFQDR
jgi:hypothetical protein